MTEQIHEVSIDLIDDPAAPMRSHMDEVKLDELAKSIAKHGLIQPITLRRAGDRYEVVAGHRRFKAVKIAGLAKVTAVVREIEEEEADELKVHENLFREDVNPVDEARHIVHMIDRYGKSPKELAEMVGKSETYVRARYDLLQFPEYLIEAVETEDISLSAAQWLARIDNDVVRKDYTRFARLGGITAKRAEAWYRSYTLNNLPRNPEQYEEPEQEERGEAPPLLERCVLCQHEDELDNLRMGYIHAECGRAAADVGKR